MSGAGIVVVGIAMIGIAFLMFAAGIVYRKTEGKRIQEKLKKDYE